MRTLAPRTPPPRGIRRAVLTLLLSIACTTSLAIPPGHGAADLSVWVTNGGVNSIVADGNTLFVGGAITQMGPVTGSGVPVSTTTFAAVPGFPRIVGSVSAVAPDGAGGWYVAGVFTWVGGVARQNLAHITAANTVDDWSPSVDAQVDAMVVTPTEVIIGGTFTTVNGLSRPRLARLSRTTAQVTAWTPAPNDRVMALETDGTTLYVAGWFGSIALTSRAGLAAFTLATDALTPWDPAATTLGPSVQIRSLALANGYVYVAGSFNHIGGLNRFTAAALRPGNATATSWNPSVPFPVTALRPIGDRVILGGLFSSTEGLAAVDTASGARFPLWNPPIFPFGSPPDGSPGMVLTIAALGSRVAVGGAYAGYFAVFDTSSSVGLVAPKPPGSVQALAVQGGTLYMGGQFKSLMEAGSFENLVAVGAVTGQPTGWAADATHEDYWGGVGSVSALAADASRVYAVVSFSDPMSGMPRSQVQTFSRANAARLWLAECDYLVNAIACRNGVVYAGGSFSFLNGAKQNLAALDGATGALQPWAPAPNTTVRSLLATPDALVVGGEFASIGGQPRARIAQVDYASGAASGWNPGADNTVWALARTGSTLYVGGDFANTGGQPRARVAALDLGANAALPWNPGADNQVLALLVDGGTVYAGGNFLTFAGQPVSRFAGVNATTGSPISWGANPNGSVRALAVGNGHVFIGGSFSAVDTEPLSGLAGVFDPALLGVDPPPAVPSVRLAVGPSPMRTMGAVTFTLDHDTAVWLRVFDVSGRAVRTLVAGETRPAGTQRIELDRSGLAPGVYHLRLLAGATRATARFVVLP